MHLPPLDKTSGIEKYPCARSSLLAARQQVLCAAGGGGTARVCVTHISGRWGVPPAPVSPRDAGCLLVPKPLTPFVFFSFIYIYIFNFYFKKSIFHKKAKVFFVVFFQTPELLPVKNLISEADLCWEGSVLGGDEPSSQGWGDGFGLIIPE